MRSVSVKVRGALAKNVHFAVGWKVQIHQFCWWTAWCQSPVSLRAFHLLVQSVRVRGVLKRGSVIGHLSSKNCRFLSSATSCINVFHPDAASMTWPLDCYEMTFAPRLPLACGRTPLISDSVCLSKCSSPAFLLRGHQSSESTLHPAAQDNLTPRSLT